MKYGKFFKEIWKGKTIARALFFLALEDLFKRENDLAGNFKILEIGAEPASHHRALPSGWKIVGSNFKPLPGVNVIIDAEKKFPIADNEFDGVICFNTLYVIKNYENCVNEMLRAAKKFVIFNVPLISANIDHPSDYTRLTEPRLEDMLGELKANGKIREYELLLVGGSFTAAASLVDLYLKFRPIRMFVGLWAVVLDRLDKMIKRQCPIMYLVLAKK